MTVGETAGSAAGAFRFAALSKATLLAAVAAVRTEGGGAEAPGLAAFRAARREAAGVAKMTSAARLRGAIAAFLDIKREEGSRKTSRKAAEKTEEKNN
jgi:hypothetical protein